MVSVDVVALRVGTLGRALNVAAAPRQWEPFAGQLALPGVLLGRGERLAAAATRALTTKLGVAVEGVRGLGQLVTFDEPNRDPRGPTLSLAMWAVLDSAAEAAQEVDWFPFGDAPNLAFDHNRILDDSRLLLAAKLWKDLAFTRALTGEVFTATRAVELAEALHGGPVHRANLNRVLASTPGLERAEQVLQVKQTGRPAAVWRWATTSE